MQVCYAFFKYWVIYHKLSVHKQVGNNKYTQQVYI